MTKRLKNTFMVMDDELEVMEWINQHKHETRGRPSLDKWHLVIFGDQEELAKQFEAIWCDGEGEINGKRTTF